MRGLSVSLADERTSVSLADERNRGPTRARDGLNLMTEFRLSYAWDRMVGTIGIGKFGQVRADWVLYGRPGVLNGVPHLNMRDAAANGGDARALA